MTKRIALAASALAALVLAGTAQARDAEVARGTVTIEVSDQGKSVGTASAWTGLVSTYPTRPLCWLPCQQPPTGVDSTSITQTSTYAVPATEGVSTSTYIGAWYEIISPSKSSCWLSGGTTYRGGGAADITIYLNLDRPC